MSTSRCGNRGGFAPYGPEGAYPDWQDPLWLKARARAMLVRVDTLCPGVWFVPVTGGRYYVRREHGAHRGVFIAVRSDGFETSFAGCAEVLPCPHMKRVTS